MGFNDCSAIKKLFDVPVIAGVKLIDDYTNLLYEEELIEIRGSVSKYQREFSTGRVLVKELYRLIASDSLVLLKNNDGSPRWPVGVIGSISHGDKYCAAVVAKVDDSKYSIGIDVERKVKNKFSMLDLIATPCEKKQISRINSLSNGVAELLIFSAKESFFKAYNGKFKDKLDFQSINFRLKEENTFCFEPNNFPLSEYEVTGKFLITEKVIMTGVTIKKRA